MDWWSSLGPELTKGLLTFIFGGGLAMLWKARQAEKRQKATLAVEGNSHIVELTEKLQEMSRVAVDQATKDMHSMRDELDEVRYQLRVMIKHERACTDWHVDHLRNFDTPAKRIIARAAPNELDQLVLRPYPKLEYIDEPHSRQSGQ